MSRVESRRVARIRHLQRAAAGHSRVRVAALDLPTPGLVHLLAAVFVTIIIMVLAYGDPAAATPQTTPPASPSQSVTTSTSLVLKGQVKKDYENLKAEAEAVQAEIDRLDQQVATLNEEYSELEIRLEELNAELVKLRRQLRTAEESYSYREELIGRRLASIYKAGDGGMLRVLLLSENLNDFMNRLVLVYRTTEVDQDLAEDFRASADETNFIQQQIEARKAEGMTLQEQLAAKRVEIEGLLVQREQTLANLDARIKTLLEQERQRQEEERLRLEAELRARLAAEAAARARQTALPQNADAIAQQVVETAAAYLGIPYRWGGKLPSSGLDCSGLTKWVFEQHGVLLRHWSRHQAEMGAPVDPSDIQPGDLLAFGDPVHHVGIYIGEGRFIHAPRTGDVVKISPLAKRSDLTAIRRFPLLPRVGPPAWG